MRRLGAVVAGVLALVALWLLVRLTVPPDRYRRPLDPNTALQQPEPLDQRPRAAPDQVQRAQLAGQWLLLSGRLGAEPDAAELSAQMAALSDELRDPADGDGLSPDLDRRQRALLEALDAHPDWSDPAIAQTVARVERLLDQ